jgi:hypothetical protein
MFKEDTKKFYKNLATKNTEAREVNGRSKSSLEVTVGRKITA